MLSAMMSVKPLKRLKVVQRTNVQVFLKNVNSLATSDDFLINGAKFTLDDLVVKSFLQLAQIGHVANVLNLLQVFV